MKNTYVKCADWNWEDKLLYIKACIGEDIPHNKICGHSVLSKDVLLSLYRDAHYIYCLDGGMIVYDGQTKSPDIGGKSEIKLRSLKPRTKTEFVKVGCEWNAWEYLKAFSELPDSEQWFIKVSDDQYAPIHDWFNVAETIRKHNLIYRKVETEIDERQEFIEVACEKSGLSKHSVEAQVFGVIFDSGEFKLVEK
ncbi:hypothetical protein VPHK165_0095 [Vibrio phage K165]|nr:hypothetical protein MYOV022v2_p0075 [Vibrio phage 12E28.1]QZI90244.1 hypothetical protein MYOV021v2_p0075 [Vibrio phage 18E29.1]QZI90610.1 hypothetical protein MYOV023v1_p0063 [Vibrio phage 91E28.1a]